MDDERVADPGQAVTPIGASSAYVPFPAFADWDVGPFDFTDFDRYRRLLEAAKDSASPEVLEHALTTATRYAAVDTGAIEGLYPTDRGFTRTVATQSAAWEAAVESRGAHVRLAFEDALRAYEYVLDVATKSVALSEMWIRELHEIVCASQETYTTQTPVGPQERLLQKGEYKTMPNSPTLLDGRVHAYAPVIDTGPEMRRLIGELRSQAFMSAHPVVQAAYIHYSYVCIHPFADGNGRVARALASIYLYRSPGVPLVVFADQRNEYFDALEAADLGDPTQFIVFVGTRTLDAIGIIRSMLQRKSPSLEASLEGINSIFNASPLNDELRAAVARLRNLATAELRKQVAALRLPSPLNVLAHPGHVGDVAVPAEYAGVGADGDFWMSVESVWPVKIRVTRPMAVAMGAGPGAPSDLIVASRSDDGLEVWLRELLPVESETLKLKLMGWIEGKLAEVMADVQAQAAKGRLP